MIYELFFIHFKLEQSLLFHSINVLIFSVRRLLQSIWLLSAQTLRYSTVNYA